MHKFRFIYGGVILIVIILVGIFLPLGSFTPTKGVCAGESINIRLHAIRGDNLKDITEQDSTTGPTEGCAQPVTYTLYIF